MWGCGCLAACTLVTPCPPQCMMGPLPRLAVHPQPHCVGPHIPQAVWKGLLPPGTPLLSVLPFPSSLLPRGLMMWEGCWWLCQNDSPSFPRGLMRTTPGRREGRGGPCHRRERLQRALASPSLSFTTWPCHWVPSVSSFSVFSRNLNTVSHVALGSLVWFSGRMGAFRGSQTSWLLSSEHVLREAPRCRGICARSQFK